MLSSRRIYRQQGNLLACQLHQKRADMKSEVTGSFKGESSFFCLRTWPMIMSCANFNFCHANRNWIERWWYSQYSKQLFNGPINYRVSITTKQIWAWTRNIFSFDSNRKSTRLFSWENACRIPRKKYFYVLKPRTRIRTKILKSLFNFVSWTKKFCVHMLIIKFSCCVYRLGAHETQKWFIIARVDFRSRVIPWREKIRVNSDLFSRNSWKTKSCKKKNHELVNQSRKLDLHSFPRRVNTLLTKHAMENFGFITHERANFQLLWQRTTCQNTVKLIFATGLRGSRS